MSLISIPRPMIRVPLTDRTFNDTVIKQEAVFTTLRHEQREFDGVCMVGITVIVKSYANDGGEFGTHLHDKGMPDKRIELVADNDTVVNPITGAILAIRVPFMNPTDWLAQLGALTDNYMYQGDYFQMARDGHAIEIGALITEHILAADQMGKFA